MEILSKIIIQLIACFVGWQIGKYIAIRLYIKRTRNKKYGKENKD